MANWDEFEREAPELAELGRSLLYRSGEGLALLATVRGNDLPPRIHPVNLEIVDGRLLTFIHDDSAKGRDLAEDGRYAVHAHQDPEVPHEFQARGRATLLTNPADRSLAADGLALLDQRDLPAVRTRHRARPRRSAAERRRLAACLSLVEGAQSGARGMNPNRLAWLVFVLLGACWGSSYLFIKIGVDGGLTPFTLIAIRFAVGVAVVATVFLASRQPVPRRARTYGHLFVIAIFSVALPFSLITWAERSVDSTLAAVINGAIPLCVIVIAPFVLPEERLTPGRVLGLVVGFAGVAILVGFDPAIVGGAHSRPWRRSSARRSRTRPVASTRGGSCAT